MEIPILKDILIIFSLSVVVVLIFRKMKMPAIMGFLVTGAIVGPHGLGWVDASHEVEALSEIGVVLLLFVIGIELSIKQLSAIKKTVIFGGLLQVGLTVLFTTSIFYLLDYNWQNALFIGFLFSLSSTAIVLKVVQEKNDIAKPYGRMVLGVLIFQDIIVVPMMLFTPIIAGQSGDVGGDLLSLLIKSGILMVITYVSARYVIPKLLHEVAKTRSRELFILTTVVICFSIAWFTSQAGLSLALGAFLAGLIISESDYSHQATSVILPFRELFTSLFFVSIGMLLNLSFFTDHILFVLLLTLLVILGKAFIAAVAARALNYPPRAVILTALSIFQVGEFAFILSEVGLSHGLLDEVNYQYFLSVSILSMAVTPFIMSKSSNIARYMLKKTVRKFSGLVQDEEEEDVEEIIDDELSGHLVIIGFGLNGQNVAKAARYSDIPYVVLEMNPDTVMTHKAKGENIIYGESTHSHILETLNVSEARVIVIAISDSSAIKATLREIRTISDQVHVIIRTRYVKEVDELIELGADEVIPEEFETSIEIFSRAMHKFLVPIDHIDRLADKIRSDNYNMLRPNNHLKGHAEDVIPRLDIECVRISREGGKIEGKTILQAQVREKYNVSIVALMRKNKLISNILPNTKLKRDDLLYITGRKKDIEAFAHEIRLPL